MPKPKLLTLCTIRLLKMQMVEGKDATSSIHEAFRTLTDQWGQLEKLNMFFSGLLRMNQDCNTQSPNINGSPELGGSNYSQLFKKRVRAHKYSSTL